MIVCLKGGIGNQLFCYAAARRLSYINDAELVIDDVTGFMGDTLYKRRFALGHFNIVGRRAFPDERLKRPVFISRRILRIINRYREYYERSYLEDPTLDFDARLLDFRVKNYVYLDGYWQSEGYFKDIEKIIRKDLSMVPLDNKDLMKIVEDIKKNQTVAVHVRWFDAPGKNSIKNVPPEYYKVAIKEAEATLKDCKYAIFSDNTLAALKILPLSRERILYLSNSENNDQGYSDLWLMSQCRHFIMANSTFSWWGAWLGEKKDSLVVAPDMVRIGTGAWGFKGLIPERWKKIKIKIK